MNKRVCNVQSTEYGILSMLDWNGDVYNEEMVAPRTPIPFGIPRIMHEWNDKMKIDIKFNGLLSWDILLLLLFSIRHFQFRSQWTINATIRMRVSWSHFNAVMRTMARGDMTFLVNDILVFFYHKASIKMQSIYRRWTEQRKSIDWSIGSGNAYQFPHIWIVYGYGVKKKIRLVSVIVCFPIKTDEAEKSTNQNYMRRGKVSSS